MITKVKISFADLVNSLMSGLNEREREVLQKRNALANNPKHALEEIGRQFNITRERVRQIEKEGLKRLNSFDSAKTNVSLNELESLVADYLKSHGGVMAENHLIEKLSPSRDSAEINALYFILNSILASKFARVSGQLDFHPIWKLESADLDKVIEIAIALKNIIEKHNAPLALAQVHDKFKSHEHYDYINSNEADNDAILESLLRLRSDLNRNILNQWGMHNWNTIKPKRMTDKAYLIMVKEGKPLHFADVAELINKANFDHKKAVPATVHNELILDDKYVLVGRGIYALRDWGYQEGTVADIIYTILKDNGPLAKNDLMEKALKQRMVQKTTITLVLMNKDKFQRLADGRYSITK